MFSLPSEKLQSISFLLLRVVSGAFLMIFHGYSKFFGGPESWARTGKSMSNFGIAFAPEFWGFMAAFAEFIAPVFLIIGLFTRPAAFLAGFTMIVALTSHLVKMDPWNRIEYPGILLAVFAGFIIAGAGRYSIDALIAKKKLKVNEA